MSQCPQYCSWLFIRAEVAGSILCNLWFSGFYYFGGLFRKPFPFDNLSINMFAFKNIACLWNFLYINKFWQIWRGRQESSFWVVISDAERWAKAITLPHQYFVSYKCLHQIERRIIVFSDRFLQAVKALCCLSLLSSQEPKISLAAGLCPCSLSESKFSYCL